MPACGGLRRNQQDRDERRQSGTTTPARPTARERAAATRPSFPVQAFQIGAPPPPAGTTAGTGRMVPDVCGDADPNTGYEIVVHGSQTVVGGTSAVAPLYAGLFASFGTKLGFVTPKLWQNQKAFNDITVGGNGFYNAAPGPDPCSGIGSPIGTSIAALFVSVLERNRALNCGRFMTDVWHDGLDRVERIAQPLPFVDSRRATGARARCPACAASWPSWRRWLRWDRCNRARCRGRGESRGSRAARASGEKCSAPGSVKGSGSSSSGWRRSTIKTGSPASSCRFSSSGSRRDFTSFLRKLRRRYTRAMKKPRMPRISSAPENRPTQFSRLGSRLRASPNSLPTASSVPIQRRRPNAVEEQKAAVSHAVFAGHWRSQRGQPGHKLGNHQRDCAAAAKGVLRLANTNGRFH